MNMCPTLWNRPGSLNGFDEERWTHPPTMLKTSAIEEKLRTAVGPQNLRAATESDHVSGVFAQFVVEPDDERQLAHLLAAANEADITVIPRGGGTKLDWGNPPKRADAISLSRSSIGSRSTPGQILPSLLRLAALWRYCKARWQNMAKGSRVIACGRSGQPSAVYCRPMTVGLCDGDSELCAI